MSDEADETIVGEVTDETEKGVKIQRYPTLFDGGGVWFPKSQSEKIEERDGISVFNIPFWVWQDSFICVRNGYESFEYINQKWDQNEDYLTAASLYERGRHNIKPGTQVVKYSAAAFISNIANHLIDEDGLVFTPKLNVRYTGGKSFLVQLNARYYSDSYFTEMYDHINSSKLARILFRAVFASNDRPVFQADQEVFRGSISPLPDSSHWSVE